jgi:hypothetical protein
VAQRRNRLDPDKFERRRAGRLCYACGKAGHCAFEHAADGSCSAMGFGVTAPVTGLFVIVLS